MAKVILSTETMTQARETTATSTTKTEDDKQSSIKKPIRNHPRER